MSQSYPENPRGIRQRFSRWNTTRRGTKTLKAAYAQAARDVKRMDPAVREQIGRAHMTRADLQMLAGTHVDAQFRPDRYGAVSQQLGAAMSARTSTPAPTRNPLRRIANRYSRWRNTRQGTKMLKAAFTQAARDVKRTDPAVRYAIGRSTINRSDLAALASGRMDEVFRPQGRFQNVPGQQQVQPQQPTTAARQLNDQMSQQVQSLQATLDQQSQRISSLEQTIQAQVHAQALLETRVQQLQQQIAENGQSGPDLNQQQGRQIDDNVQFVTPVAGPETSNARAVGEDNGDQSLDDNPGQQTPAGEPPSLDTSSEAETGARTVGEAETGDRPVGEAETGDRGVGEAGEPRAEVGDAAQPSMSERWLAGVDENVVADEHLTSDDNLAADGQLSFDDLAAEETAAPAVTTEEPTAEAAAPAADPQSPGVDPQAPGADTRQPTPGQQPQQPQTTGQQPQVTGQQPRGAGEPSQTTGQRPAATGQNVTGAQLDGGLAMQSALRGVAQPRPTSPEAAAKTAGAAAKDDSGKAARSGQPSRDTDNKPSGRG
ncbi:MULTISPECIES: hypothetical protein [Kribbella]|uniref:Uncharacterized protein n=1 Tax=Kribbella karoonensis TaxID=324851 RepID=A0ABP4PTJ5_9ACTN